MTLTAPRPRTMLACGVALATALTAGIAVDSAPAGATTEQLAAYGGSAYGSHVTLGSLVNVGKTAPTPLCTTESGVKIANRTAQVSLGLAGHIGVVTGQVTSAQNGSTHASTASTHTAGAVLLAGMIQLEAVTSSARVSHTGGHYVTSGSSDFLGLTIAGKSFPAEPKANSTYALPGLGSLTLNGQHITRTGGVPAITVTAFNLVLGSKNKAGLPAGQIVIGRSTASLRMTHRLPSGSAFATKISVAKVAGSGKTAAVYAPCGGTGNATKSNDLAGVKLPQGVATTGVASSTVHTTDSSSRTTSTSRNRIAGISLLGGAIKVDALTTQANAVATGTHRTTSATGTSVLGLVVMGKSVAAPRMGEHRSIPGLGTLTFGYSHKTSNGVKVEGLRLRLGSAHDGVPAGAVITIGAATAGVTLP